MVLDPFLSRALLGGTKKFGMSAPTDHENVKINLLSSPTVLGRARASIE